MTFLHFDEQFDYCSQPHNNARHNERCVEVPLALHFVDQQTGEGLEVGDVLSHYRHGTHRIVDRYDPGYGIDNLDVFEVGGTYDWIVTVSTLEHVRWDEDPREQEGSGRALRHLLDLLRPGGRMFVSIPLGVHWYLDKQILDGHFGDATVRQCTFVRYGDEWIQTPSLEYRRYGMTGSGADSVWVAELARVEDLA